ncbi:hypothetical protein BC834DRAFT_967308 [Gloeopeniophorella convolvens]|nr:hypothetical protein BC834DRAFT_967308 [Gloeopeniophorella convolvens]
MPQTEFPLPVELVVKVLTCASDEAVLACRLVSQKLRSIIDRSIILQYRLRLSATGMRDGPAPLVDLTERYEMLKKYEDALSGMAWTTHTLVSTPNSIFPAVFISGAVIAMMSDSDLGDIIFQRIPCNLRGIPTSQWRVRLGFRALNITMDASQDLIVVPEYRHLEYVVVNTQFWY